MSDKKLTESGDAQVSTPASDPAYQFRWSYDGQVAFEKKRDRKNKKHGTAVYATVLVTSFLLCFALLIGVLVWYDASDFDYRYLNGGTSAVGAVANEVKPATVLIYSASSTSYGYGTGFFLRSDGYIVTYYHVIAGNLTLTVTLYDGRTLPATVVGYSSTDDIAVIKIEGTGYPTVRIGDSDAIIVGDTAVAIGNPTGPDAAWTTTSGIISEVDRTIVVAGTNIVVEMHMIQTDAPVNAGNSGGPLCNANGEVVGIITRKFSDNEGIGLALPINGAMELIDAIIKNGDTDGVVSKISRCRPLLGVSGMNVKRGETFAILEGSSYYPHQNEIVAGHDGIAVLSVDESLNASKNLRTGDIIYEVDGVACTTVEQMIEMMYEFELGETIELTVWRDGGAKTVKCNFR